MLFTVKFVGGIHVIADMSDSHHGVHSVGKLIKFFMYRKLLPAVRRPVKFLHQVFYLCLHLIKVYALVRHILKFHIYILAFQIIFSNYFTRFLFFCKYNVTTPAPPFRFDLEIYTLLC